MQKIVFVVQFRKDMSREAAMRYWREVHAPIARKIPGLRKWVQNHATAAREGDLQFDGIGELWFDSPEAFQAAAASPEWQATIADAANFVDMEKTPAAFVNEVSIV